MGGRDGGKILWKKRPKGLLIYKRRLGNPTTGEDPKGGKKPALGNAGPEGEKKSDASQSSQKRCPDFWGDSDP